MPRLFITGASGFVGGNLARRASATWDVVGLYRTKRPSLDGISWRQADLTDPSEIARAVQDSRPDAVIHLAAMSNIDACERDSEAAFRVNVGGSETVAEACRNVGCRLIAISTDNVFDGRRGHYGESDPTGPINAYGRSKARAEEKVLERHPTALVVRIPLMLGFPVTGAGSFLGGIVAALRRGERISFFTDEYRSPCDVFTLCDALLELAAGDVRGVLHVGGTERVSRADIGRALLFRMSLPHEIAGYARVDEVAPGRTPRPSDVSFDVSLARSLLRTPLLDLEGSMDRIRRETDPAAFVL